jgi:hypothetical protein
MGAHLSKQAQPRNDAMIQINQFSLGQFIYVYRHGVSVVCGEYPDQEFRRIGRLT